ncbi:hypothetical protein [Kitasatospora purpeofusca]|uniref:hypothetical protein n=1 Tax=Kitasatospora purpeofusca TaxID=67352 RepID=UPI0036676284
MIPPAAVQTIRTAAHDAARAGHTHPDALVVRITAALVEDGWQITPDLLEAPDDTPTTPQPWRTDMTLAQAVADHPLVPAVNPCDPDLCLGCWIADGESVTWPCGPLLHVAKVDAIEGGWTISARAA